MTSNSTSSLGYTSGNVASLSSSSLPVQHYSGPLLLPISSSPLLGNCVTCVPPNQKLACPPLLVERDRERPVVRQQPMSSTSASPAISAASPLSAIGVSAYNGTIYNENNTREYSPPGPHRAEIGGPRRSQNPNSPTNTGEQLTLRSLVGTKDAGVVIGRQGANIKAIREVSKARVGVSGHVAGVPERIISISGCGEEIAKAYAEVARNLNQCDLRGSSPEAVESTPLTIRFLIPNSRMGRLIGKGGARINQIQKESNARLKALPNPMPNSGDRILEMNGVPDAIHIATYHMLETIKNQSDRPCLDRPYRPECSFSAQLAYSAPQCLPSQIQNSAMQMQTISSSGPGVNLHFNNHQSNMGPSQHQQNYHNPHQQHSHHQQQQQQHNHHNQQLYGQPQSNIMTYDHHQGGQQHKQILNQMHVPQQHAVNVAHQMQLAQHYSPTLEVRKFICPAHKIGPMIGKNGQRINRVRSDTGCKINVEDQPDENGDRAFTVTGHIRHVSMALRILDGHLRRELNRDIEGTNGNQSNSSLKGLNMISDIQ